MNDKDLQFYRHKHFGIEPISKPKVKTVAKIYQLVHIQSKQRMKHGSYALCQAELNKQPHIFRKQYKIEPYKL